MLPRTLLALCIAVALVVSGTLVHGQAKPAGTATKKRKLPPDYRVKLPVLVKAELNKPVSASLTIAPRPGYVISRDGPLYIDLSAKTKSGLTLKQRHYRRKHAADKRADSPRFDLQLRGAQAGTFVVSVAMRFWVCAKRTCRPVKDNRTLTVQVTAPVPASQPAGTLGGPGTEPTPPAKSP